MGGGPSQDSIYVAGSHGTRTFVQTVAIYSPHHKRHISAWGNGGARAYEKKITIMEQWDMYRYQDGTVVFKSRYNNDYLRATDDGNCHADGSANKHGGVYWMPSTNADGTTSFLSMFGKYLCAEPPGHSGPRQVLADRKKIGPWERFRLKETTATVATGMPYPVSRSGWMDVRM